MSRPRPSGVGQLVSRPGVLRSRPGASCLGVSRPARAQQVRDLRWLCARPVGRARSSAHDLGTACAVCARPGFWVCALCTQPSFVTVHYLESLFEYYSWTLFKSTVHRVKKNYKNFKIFLGGDLIYEIFILHLL